jgi:hypothetical protein
VAGPSQAIAAAVRTAVTDGMRLATPVSVDDRAWRRSSWQAWHPSTEEAREALSAQVVWTLRQLPEVRDIRIRVGGRPLEAGSAAEVLDRDAWPQYDPAVLASDAEAYRPARQQAGRAGGTAHAPLPNAAGTGERPLSQFAVSIDRTTLAGLSGGRLYVGPLDGSQPMAR